MDSTNQAQTDEASKAPGLSPFALLWAQLEVYHKHRLFILLGLMIFAALIEMAGIAVTMRFIQALIEPGSIAQSRLIGFINSLGIDFSSNLAEISLLLAIILLLSGTLRILLIRANTAFMAQFNIWLRHQIFERVLNQPFKYHIRQNSNQLISVMTEKAEVAVWIGGQQCLLFITQTVIATAIVTALIITTGLISISAFAFIGITYLIVVFCVRNYVRAQGEIVNREQPIAIEFLREGIGGIRDVLIGSTQKIYTNLYRDTVTKVQTASANVQVASQIPKPILESLGMVLIIAIALAMQSAGQGNLSTLPVLGAFAFGAQRLLPCTQQIYQAWSSIRGTYATILEILSFLALPKEPATQATPMGLKQGICFEKVGFRYDTSNTPVFENIDLDIARGTKVGLAGQTGSGKSTLLDLLMGLLEPSSGRILVDGQPLSAQDMENWRQSVAHVPQHIFLTNKSVAENIAFGVPSDRIDMEKVIEAARKAQIHEVIEALEQGYDTVIGENGIRLSGGQRQRIGIARALYRPCDLIIFDEATSALDVQTEQKVMQAINQLDAQLTIVMVTHRLATLDGCDQIFELNDGVLKIA